MHQLPAELIINKVVELKQELLKFLSDNSEITLDISQVVTADTASLQLLCALQKNLNEAGQSIKWHGQSDAFSNAVATLGLEQYLAIS